MITVISTLLAFVAAFFYLRADYISLIIGTILLNMSYILDCTDGELARYKNMSSKFGGWWDSVGDRTVEYAVFSSLALGLYLFALHNRNKRAFRAYNANAPPLNRGSTDSFLWILG